MVTTKDTAKLIWDISSRLNNKNVSIGDTFTNPALQQGYGSEDPSQATFYPFARYRTWNLRQIESVMRADPIFIRALEYRSKMPFKHGLDMFCDSLDSKVLVKFQKLVRDKLNNALQETVFLGDGFGWSAGLLLVKGETNERDLKQPLRREDIEKDRLQGIKPLTRWYQISPDMTFIDEIGDKHNIHDPRLLGEPLYYRVSFQGDTKKNFLKVHRTRLVFFNRNKLTFIEKKIEHGGGSSLLESGYDALSRYHNRVAMIDRILNKSVVPILKLNDMASASLMNEKGSKELESKIDLIRYHLTNNNLLVIGDEETLEFAQVQLNELSNLLEEARLEVCMAFATPPQELFFKDIKTDYDFDSFIKERQKFEVREMYNQVLPLFYKSWFGEELPEEFDFKYKALREEKPIDIAEAKYKTAQALEIFYKLGAMNKKGLVYAMRDIDNNPTDVLRNIPEEYIQYVDGLSPEIGYNTDQIELAKALNQDGGDVNKAKKEGAERGGDPERSKKPTPRVPVNRDKEE